LDVRPSRGCGAIPERHHPAAFLEAFAVGRGIILYSAFHLRLRLRRRRRRKCLLPPFPGESHAAAASCTASGAPKGVEEVVDVTSNFRAHRGAGEAESSALFDINDLGPAAPCTADGEGGVQDPARHKGEVRRRRTA
jgi:hypothetical protein